VAEKNANMCSYDELLVELGELPAVVRNASPFIQLCMLITFNTVVYIGSEMIMKFFKVDLLYVIAGFVGAKMGDSPENNAMGFNTPASAPAPSPHFSAFSANFA
jgi:hypothetical protein